MKIFFPYRNAKYPCKSVAAC